ncbi:putative phosphohistidine phosphatase, SixA [Cellulophaga algicola DSM 14237]|uniref:Phosphohistidine phosphatase, SixA n=1 Tax=Cellulophaga algicola (strain DSM 14237 / IC166 / ACAM 630) TaxID=688270 RepID=E6XDM9_CELAD|nr:histidine phosphatase family protein [Cellulophaga algicola]ADV50171.1 putative phosphohistidine phosphatase, SixA [Cellulophaga algicola DSM 14237]
MKTIYLMRHGKSTWDYAVSDNDRPLKERGIEDAHLVAEAIHGLNLKIDASYSSPANRALHTAMITLKDLSFPLHKFQISNDLYDFSGESVLQFIKELNNDLNFVFIFGHNHAFTEIANTLGSQFIENVPTAGFVQLNFEVENWKAIRKGITQKILFPKQLRS